MFKKIVILPIRAYQYLLRPFLPNSCVFNAHGKMSCSEYTIYTIKHKGVIKGIMLGGWRIARCNPWQRSFNDPE
jgi:putative membrane protein insertion efficiency factor